MAGALSAILVVPIIILNSLAGLVGGVWLLWLGEWKLVLGGFLLSVFAPFWASLLVMPGMIFAIPGIAAIERGNTWIGTILVSLSGLWTYTVVTIWCLVAFWYVPQFGSNSDPFLPFLLFAYAVATAPWALMAQKETQSGGGSGAQLTVSGACLGCALILAYVLIAEQPDFFAAIWFLIVPMAAVYIFSIIAAIIDGRSSRLASY